MKEEALNSKILEVKNLKAGYEALEILKGISMHVKKGEIVAIIGPNGAGKSTLLKSIFNICDIYSGEIIFKGRNITKAKTFELIKHGISYIPQGRGIFPTLTVAENLEIAGYALDKKEVEARISKVFKMFPFLEKRSNDYAFSLSGGQQQILSFARALIQNPELMMLDEPSLGMAPKIMSEIFRTIEKINKEFKIAMLIVEQNAKQAVSISDRTYVLEDGKVAMEGDRSILKDERIKDIYFGGR